VDSSRPITKVRAVVRHADGLSFLWHARCMQNTDLERSDVQFKRFGFVLGILISAAPRSGAQTVLDVGRRIDWSQAGVPSGIPKRTSICATLNPTATHTQINTAIAACRDGVVFLSAGTYKLAGGISFGGKSQVTLRGAGPARTILTFTGADPCGGLKADVCVHGASTVWVGAVPEANVHTWKAGYEKGATELTLDSTNGLMPGMIAVLDQLDDVRDTGEVIVNGQEAGPFSIEGSAPGRPNRTQQQFVKVTAVAGNRMTISPGLYMPNWRAAQSPQIWFWGPAAQTAFMNGVEDLTVDHGASTNDTAGIAFANAYGCWVKNVKSVGPNRNHVWLYQTAHNEVRDSYFYGTKNAASQSYGVESFMTSDNLVVNNIFQHVTTPIMTGPSSGNVAAYNFVTDMFYSSTPLWNMAGIAASHDSGSAMNLFEGNEGNSFVMDLYHGPGAFATAFRNYLTGRDGQRTSNTEVVHIWAFNRFVNFIGNVLGTSGYHSVYEDSRGPQGRNGQPDRSIYLLGYSAVGERTSSGILYDLRAVTTLLRWGNFDYATSQTRWNSEEVPSGHPIPTTRTLPASMFLASKPAWWGTTPWPPIGPDVTGGQDPAGHAHKIPAHVCYESCPKNPDGTLEFDAGKCYGNIIAPVSGPKRPSEKR
jgi:hypothetical protein